MDILIAAAVVLLILLLVLSWVFSVFGPVLLVLLKVAAALVALGFILAVVMALLDPQGFKKAQAEADERRRQRAAPAVRAKQEWNSRPKRPK